MTDTQPTQPAHDSGSGDVPAGDAEVVRSSPWRLAGFLAALAALGVFGGVGWLVIVLALLGMIFLHELGHYVMAKRAGMKVTEFFIGFGPRLWSFQRGETEYGMKAIPAGAYVKILGMSNLEPVDAADESRTYRQKSFPQRIGVAVAGSTMHFLLAIFLLTLLYGLVGTSKFDGWEMAGTRTALDASDRPVSPAADAGLREGDRLLALDSTDVTEFADFREFVQANPGKTVEVSYLRGDEVFQTMMTLATREDAEGTYGFAGLASRPREVGTERANPAVAVGKSVQTFGDITWESVSAIPRFFTPSVVGNLFEQAVEGDNANTGPASRPGSAPAAGEGENRPISIYGAARLGTQLFDDGIEPLLWLFALLNIFVGVFNLLPLLPLDGGHVAVACYERIRSRNGVRYHVDFAKLLPVTYVVFMVMVTFGLLTLLVDIRNPINL